MQKQGGTMDQATLDAFAGAGKPCLQCAGAVGRRQGCAAGDNLPGAQIAVRMNVLGRLAGDGWMAGQVNGVGDQCCRHIRFCCGGGQNGGAVGNPEAEAAAMTSACRNAPRGHRVGHAELPQRGAILQRHAKGERLARVKMNGDVPAVVHVSPSGVGLGDHRGKNRICNTARHSGHGGDKPLVCIGLCGPHHTAGGLCLSRALDQISPGAQQGQLIHQPLQDAVKRSLCGVKHLRAVVICADDQINRAVLQMQPGAAGQWRGLRAHQPSSPSVQR